jgi:prepilin-type processing-associated H-X9-DG protein
MNLTRKTTAALLAAALTAVLPCVLQADDATPTAAPPATAPTTQSAVLPASVQNAMGPGTLGVIVMDMSRLDMNALQTWMAAGITQNISDKSKQDLMIQSSAEELKTSQTWIDNFTKAGGTNLYVILDLSVIQQNPPVMVVRLAPGANAHAIGAILQSGDPKGPSGPQPKAPQSGPGSSYSEQDGDAVICADPEQHQQIAQNPGVMRPEIAEAMTLAGDSPMRVGIAPSIAAVTMLATMMPQLPPSLGGAATAAVVGGIKAIGVGVQLPPQGSLVLNADCKDHTSALLLKTMLDAAINTALAASHGSVDAPRVVAALSPTVQDTQVLIHPDRQQSNYLQTVAMQMIIKLRERALVTQAISQVQQLNMLCLMYANDHNGQFPPDADTLKPPANLLKDPNHPDQPTGFTYLAPKAKVTDAASTTVLWYENLPATAGKSVVGFVDGHVELQTAAQLKQALDAQGATTPPGMDLNER